MANGKHFIPGAGPAYDTFFNNVRQYTNAKCSPPDAPEWSFIPSTELAGLNDAYTDWHAAYLPTLKPHTPAETAARNAAWKRAQNTCGILSLEFASQTPPKAPAKAWSFAAPKSGRAYKRRGAAVKLPRRNSKSFAKFDGGNRPRAWKTRKGVLE